VPSTTRGGIDSSSHAPTGLRGIFTKDEDEDEDNDHKDVDQWNEEFGPS
jgi:hypothetical protein